MPVLTPQELADTGGCFNCMDPVVQQTMLLSLLQQIQVASIDAARTTTSPGGLLTATATAAANAGRRRFVIQNQKAEHLHVKFGTGCTALDYHYVIQSAATVGTPGASLTFEGYTGAISVAPVAGNPSYTFAEFV
jgi:hypothetical protein